MADKYSGSSLAGEINSKKFPLFLTENPLLRYLTFSALYVAQGVPEGITYFAIPAWLAMNGKTPMEVGSFLAVVGIPWSFKILIAPLLDRFTILSMGRKRPWVIFGQLGLIASFLSIGFVADPLSNLQGLMVAGFFISFFGAFQDVATDGMAIDVVPVQQQARANGLMWGAKVIGTSLSLIVGTALINSIGFSSAISLLSIVVAFIMLVPLFFRERRGEKLLPWTVGSPSEDSKNLQLSSWKQLFKNITKVVSLPSSIFLGIAIFIVGIMIGLVDAVLPVFTIQELGWSNTSYSHIYSITTIISGVLGMLVGGVLIDYFGKIKMMSIYLLLLVLAIGAFSFLSGFWKVTLFMYGFVLVYYILYIFLTISIFATAMHLCWKTVAATQFTLYMAITNVGRAAGSGLLGPLKNNLSWQYFFLLIAIIPLIMLLLIQFINSGKHQTSITTFDKIPEVYPGS